MNQRRASLLIGLATAAVFLFRGPALPVPQAQPPGNPAAQPFAAAVESAARGRQQRPEEKPAASAAAAAAAAAQRLAPSRREYARLYRDLLGIEPPEPTPTEIGAARVRGKLGAEPLNLAISALPREKPVDDCALAEISAAARKNSYHLEFMIALVADPIDSGLASDFDLTMGALQLGLAESRYRLDRQWLPWADPDAADGKKYRETAGLMLFRRDPDGDWPPLLGAAAGQHWARPEHAAPGRSEPRHLLAVFVVGETLKLGIHIPAFDRAVDFILDLHAQDVPRLSPSPADCAAPAPAAGAAPCLEIPVLGPSYSGSVDSLRLALAGVRQRTCSRFRIVSGSASAPGLEERMAEPLPGNAAVTARFSRTVVSDDDLAAWGLSFLHDRLGWNLDHAALLVERDTAEGSFFSEQRSQITKLRFPSGIFALRNAWEASARFAPPAQEIASNPKAFATPKTALEVSLVDQQTPVDVVPELSPISTRIYDMAMADLLRDIAAEGFAYVGILATDVKDQLFLAEQIRRWAPNVILFVIDNNLLYVHPQYNTAMFGTLTISSFPLATEGGRLALSPEALESRERRQFASERQEGTFLAVRNLVRHAPFPRTVWITVSGNYAMWPLAALDARSGRPYWPVTPEAPGPSRQASRSASSEPEVLGPLVLSRTEATPKGQPAIPRRPEPVDLKLLFLMLLVCVVSYLLQQDAIAWATLWPRTRLLMTGAIALLCLAGGFIVRLWLARLLSLTEAVAGPRRYEWMLLAALVLGYVYLLCSFIKALYDLRKDALGAFAFAGLPLLLAVTWAAFKLWRVDDDPGLFYQRASAFSGGVSPLVSLAWYAEAAFLWLVVELKRQMVRERHRAGWPLAAYDEPALASLDKKASEIGTILETALPHDRSRWAVVIIVGPASFFLWIRMQPIAESRAFGQAFLVLGMGLSALSSIAFIRFSRTWWRLRGVLRDIELTDLLEAVKRVGPEAGWKPTHFTWYEPEFSILKRSVERLQRLVAAEVSGQPGLSRLLKDTFTEAHNGRLDKEIELRKELDRRLCLACNSLGDLRHLPAVQDFYAIRLIAYLRWVFHQLRYSLMGAMGCGLSLIVGTSTLAFQPKGYISLVLWTMLAVASAATLVVFVQMDRDATLSAIACTPAGKVTYDWHLLSKVLLYVLPVLGLIASQFPSVGRIFNSLFDPLARVLGSG
jgi:hypothetical protein